jgi:DNA-binding beta-propeller fold protein YncE
VSDANGVELENYPISIEITDVHDDLIPSMVQYRGRGQYVVTFRPEVSGLHRIQVKFLDQVIRGGTFALDVRSNDPVDTIGGKNNEDADMEYPRSVAVDRQNNLYVVDTGNNRIQKFNKSGHYMSELTISNESEIYTSCGRAVDDIQGRLICPEVCVQEADLSEASAILVYSIEGELLERFVYRDIMRRALSVAVDSASHMIIADYELHTIFIFDKNGRLLHKFGEHGSGPGQFNNPTFLCIGENNTIIVSDGNNHRIQVFDRMGKFLYQFGKHGTGKGQFNMPFGVAADFHGNVLVVDGRNKRVQVFKQGGEFLSCMESFGDCLSAPRGIAVTSDGHALVADRDNHCVKKYKYLHCTSL